MNKFEAYIDQEKVICEYFLRKTQAYDSVPASASLSKEEYIDIPMDEWTRLYGKRPDWKYVEVNSQIKKCYEKLGVLSKHSRDEAGAAKYFGFLSFIDRQEPETARSGEADMQTRMYWARTQLRKGIHLDLAEKLRDHARQYFELCAANCLLSQEDLVFYLEKTYFDDIAVPYLWRGYALLRIGAYAEACSLLRDVVPYFNQYKLKGGEVWQKVEYALPAALVPLCEYLSSPSEDGRQKAKSGLDNFIKSLKENKDRLEGYLYYYHLKAMFPDAYGDLAPVASTRPARPGIQATPGAGDAKPLIGNHGGFYETHGSVIIFDRKSGSLEVFGTNKDLENYVEKVKSLGNYPVLSRLFEIYALEEEQEPQPLVEACERLLATPGVDGFVKAKTESLLEVARDAGKVGSGVIMYFDPEA